MSEHHMSEHHKYLGDSVYVEIENCMIKLTTNNGYPDDPRNTIYLEPHIFDNLVAYVKRVKDIYAARSCQQEKPE